MIGRTGRFLWRSRWGVVRLAVAATLTWTLAADTGARLARLQLATMPGFDFIGEVRHLADSGRYGEAVMIADAGAELAPEPERGALAKEREAVIARRDSVLRRIKDVGLGALSGEGDSLEGLAGAIGADLFVVGDVRDLLLQGARYVADGESDEVLVLLSAVGIVTTLAPEIDWAPSLFKAARRTGTLSTSMAEWVKRTVKARDADSLRAVFKDSTVIAEKASVGGAVHLLALADTPADVADIARFVSRNPQGAFVLHVTGREGLDGARAAERAGGAASADRALALAASKGERGAAFVRSPAFRALVRPHLLIGIGKGFWKGNAQEAVARALAAIDPFAWWTLPALAAWLFIECGLLVLGWRRESRPARGAPGRRVGRLAPA